MCGGGGGGGWGGGGGGGVCAEFKEPLSYDIVILSHLNLCKIIVWLRCVLSDTFVIVVRNFEL